MKTIYETTTYPQHDDCAAGWDVTIRADSTARITWRNPWQGTSTGETRIIDVPEWVMEAVRRTVGLSVGPDDQDADAAIAEWHADADWSDEGRLIRRGT